MDQLLHFSNNILDLLTYIIISLTFYYILKMIFYKDTWHSFIPIFRYYIMYKIYAYRVYKKDFSKFYLAALVAHFLAICFSLAILMDYSFKLRISSQVEISDYPIKILLLIVPIIIISLIIELGVLVPIFKSKKEKIIFTAAMVCQYILKLITSYIYVVEVEKSLELSFAFIDFIFVLIVFLVVRNNFKKWHKGECSVVQISSNNEVIEKRQYSLFE